MKRNSRFIFVVLFILAAWSSKTRNPSQAATVLQKDNSEKDRRIACFITPASLLQELVI